MTESTFYINPDDIVRDARTTVANIVRDEGFVHEHDLARHADNHGFTTAAYVAEQIAQATHSADRVTPSFDQGQAHAWTLGQLQSMPRTYSERCELGKAFTKAVLHVLNDVFAEATPDGQDAMRKLLGVVDAHMAMAVEPPQYDGGVAPDVPRGTSEQWCYTVIDNGTVFVHGPFATGADAEEARDNAAGYLGGVHRFVPQPTWSLVRGEYGQEGVVGPFMSEHAVTRWAMDSDRHGYVRQNEQP